MPGRISARPSTASQPSRISSVPSLGSRASRISSPKIVAPDEGPSTALRIRVCAIFGDAQLTTAGHRKLVVNLRKLHDACCYEPPSNAGKSAADDFEEDDFNVEIGRCVIRLVGVKKGESAGDRVVRFLGLYLRYASDKDAVLIPENDVDDTQAFPETPSTRLTSHVISILLPLLGSKEKVVRYRATQLVSHVINSLDSIDDDYYHLLRAGLLKRIRDKEPMVRVQAVLGLGRLAGNAGDEDVETDSEEEDSSGLLERLLEVLQNDPSADVRRSLLLNLPLTPVTLPYLLERARDLDTASRRALYSRLLPALGDFRHLSMSMREKLLRWGLRDRDENVRKAAARIFRERWIEDCCQGQEAAEGHDRQGASVSIDGLLELMERIDVINSGGDSGVALEAMKDFWNGRPDYREAISFEDKFWDCLTPESAFLVRTFNDFCRAEEQGRYGNLLEEKLPEVTKFGFFLQRYINGLVEEIRRADAASAGNGEEDTIEQEFIVEQLLHIADTLDYTDEVGRRKMFALLRETLAIADLPDEITELTVNVLRGLCGADAAGEREFCAIVLEAVAEVHDTIATDETSLGEVEESFHSAQPEINDSTPTKSRTDKKLKNDTRESCQQDEEKAIQEIMVNMKCLHIAKCMLQNVEGDLQQNVHLVTMLNNLVVPAVRSREAPIRERGLLCLGLCCLLDKTLAQENLELFLHCFRQGHDALQVNSIHILCDIMVTHSSLISAQVADPAVQKAIFKVFSKALKAKHTPDVQFTATTALCKLMLTNVIENDDLLKQLVLCYFEPETKGNAGLRQALTYFLPVYCHSRRENMERMGRIVPSIMQSMIGLGEELDEEEDLVDIGVVATMLVDWTDARKLVVQGTGVSWNEAGKQEELAVNGDIHLEIAESLLDRAMTHSCSKDEKKVLISMLGKIYVTASSSKEKLQSVHELVTEAVELKTANEAATRNALNKLHMALSKALGESSTERQATIAEEKPVIDQDDVSMAEVEETQAPVSSSEDETEMEVEEEVNMEGITNAKDSILDSLLDDEDET